MRIHSFVIGVAVLMASCHRSADVNTPPASSVPSPTARASARASTAAIASATTGVPVELSWKPDPLPGANGSAFLDYLFYEPGRSRVWVPAGATGSVDVLDTATGAFVRIEGFKTTQREVRGKPRTLGPSAGAVGEGVAYIGDRASSEICPIDLSTLRTGQCFTVPEPIDGVEYVASTREVWVTAPRDRSLVILDASVPSALRAKTVLELAGEPEGYAVDEGRGLFFTNLEDADRTVVIDARTREVRSTWNPGCGAEDPRGLAIDPPRSLLFVACTDHVAVLDTARNGAVVGRVDGGPGVDNIDYLPSRHLLYVAAARAARLTIARVDDPSHAVIVATAETSEGARNAIADASGNAYVADSKGARLLVFASRPTW